MLRRKRLAKSSGVMSRIDNIKIAEPNGMEVYKPSKVLSRSAENLYRTVDYSEKPSLTEHKEKRNHTWILFVLAFIMIFIAVVFVVVTFAR